MELLRHLPAVLIGLAVLITLIAMRGALRKVERRVAMLTRRRPDAAPPINATTSTGPMAELRDMVDAVHVHLNELIENAEAARHGTARAWDQLDDLAAEEARRKEVPSPERPGRHWPRTSPVTPNNCPNKLDAPF